MASHLLNLLPSTSINNDTPHLRLYNKHPSYSHIRTFGCLCYPHVQTPHKLAPRTTPCVFLGYPSQHRGFRCLDLHTRKIIISRHVVFHESIFPLGSVNPTNISAYDFLDSNPDLDASPLLHQLIHQPSPPPPPPTTNISPSSPTSTSSPISPNPSAQINPTAHSNPVAQTVPDPIPDPIPQTEPTHPMTTRARSGISKPIQRLNLHTSTLSPAPRSHLQALEDPNWTKAMHEEYRALEDLSG